MAAPPLRIPVALDMESFRQQTEKASSHVGSTTRAIATQFAKMNAGIAVGGAAATGAYAASWVVNGARIVTAIGAVALAAKALGGLIGGAREEIADMVAVADKANKAGLSAEFFQSFVAGAKGAADQVKVLEKALENASRNTLPKLDTTVAIHDSEKLKTVWSDIEQAIQRSAIVLQGNSFGPQLFQMAANADERVKSVLITMRDLVTAGQRLEAMNLGQKMFGAEFVDSIRTGKVVLDDLIRTIETRLAGVNGIQLFGEQIISNETVNRAKQLDDRLKEAWRTSENNLKPTWGVLGNLALDIKNIWVQIVELMARATSILPNVAKAMSDSDRSRLSTQRDEILAQMELGNLSRVRQNQLQNQLNTINSAIGPIGVGEPARTTLAPISLEDIRRGLGGPTPKPAAAAATGPSARNRFESSADVIEKRTAALEAEIRTIDLGTEARSRTRVAAELETVAKQINKEAGRGANVVTEEQRQRIDELAAAYGRAALAIENARSPLNTFARESANINKQLNQFGAESLNQLTNEMAAVVTGTKSVQDAFRAMANAIIQDLARIAIRQAITGPIAAALGGLFNPAGGAVPIPLTGVGGIGHAAGGTDNWRGGLSVVGEQGPELLNLPRGSQVIPNHLIGRSSQGGDINVSLSMDLTGVNGDETIRRISAAAAQKAFNAAVATANAGVPARQARYRQLGT